MSIVLRRVVLGALYATALSASQFAFASCGDRGRHCQENDPLIMDRVGAIGELDPFDVNNRCYEVDCDWEWLDDPSDEGDGGSGSEPIPLPDTPPPDVEDLDGRCVNWTIPVPMEVGGGSTRVGLCFNDDDSYRLTSCQDNYVWLGDACPYLMP